jgi:glycosyltransferase involved in cell wall biosynthesis
VRVTFLTWRDTGHPDGGGSELYVEEIARRLAGRGHDVTILCARYPGSSRSSFEHGVRFLRRGGRLTVYLHGLLHVLLPSGRRQDVVVEVINGLPFGARLVRRAGLLAVVHHVHQDQWRLIYPGLGGRVGWFVESRVTPVLYRRTPHVTVSEASRRDLIALGLPADGVRIVHNGLTTTRVEEPRATTPRLVVLARLVPHKRIEHAFTVLAALRQEFPEIRLDVIGSGWWHDALRAAARDLGVEDLVVWHGHVPDDERDRLLARAWIALLPSTKEGWGLSVTEAAAQGTPTVAYREAGGVNESIEDGVTGVIVDGPASEAMVAAVLGLLREEERLARLASAARERAGTFSWAASTLEFEGILEEVARTRDQFVP